MKSTTGNTIRRGIEWAREKFVRRHDCPHPGCGAVTGRPCWYPEEMRLRAPESGRMMFSHTVRYRLAAHAAQAAGDLDLARGLWAWGNSSHVPSRVHEGCTWSDPDACQGWHRQHGRSLPA